MQDVCSRGGYAVTFSSLLTQLQGSHDLRLSHWGPYTKRYMGISHIPELTSGLRVDLSVFPALYRRTPQPPNVLWESGYHPWEAAPDLSFYRHRHELVWKDQVYADVDYCRLDEERVLVWMTCVNQTSVMQNLAAHWVLSLHFPPRGHRHEGPLQMCQVTLPSCGVWVEALDYAALVLGEDEHRINLSYDGLRRGEERINGFVQGLGLGQGFGLHTGDAVTYRVRIPRPIVDAVLVLRYQLQDGVATRLEFPGLNVRSVRLRGSGSVQQREIHLRRTLREELIFTIVPEWGVPIQLDGFALVPAISLGELQFPALEWNPAPEEMKSPKANALILRYAHVRPTYGLAWGVADGEDVPYQVREFLCDDLDATLRLMAHDHVHDVLVGPGRGHFVDVFQRPVVLPPNSVRSLCGLICCGAEETVAQSVESFDPTTPEWVKVHTAARERRWHPSAARANPSGEPYVFSQERMAATLATNVVYPVRTRGTWIRHYTPGRWWDSLYTWDSGFIGLGLLELDVERALDNLNAYLTTPGDEDAAFIHHGSPVPTQFYLFTEIWQRTSAPELLEYFYPRLQQYHRFLAGRLGSSTTRTLKSNLIRTWDYFYNSGGWDDYPAQVYVHRNGLTKTVTPVVSTAQVIRTAKILRMVALALGEDVGEYEEDIELLSEALQRYAWDESSGYFSYVVHDDEGWPVDILRHDSGVNFNMGMDGVYPLVAGICTPEQEQRLVATLMAPEHLWTPYGLTTVDQSAPYYRAEGYWNGAVWMAHQWFFWKALLDMGRLDEAHQVACTALEVWEQEVARTYNCYEHFIVRTGRGAGWHHFGGLSAPVLNWFSAYHRAGRLTTGLDMWVTSLEVTPGADALTADLVHYGPAHHAPGLIVTLVPGSYCATWNGSDVPMRVRYPGTLELTLPIGVRSGQLVIHSRWR